MKLHHLWTLSAVAALAAWADPAWAARPLASEDAAILDKGTCEFELVSGRTTSAGAARVRELETLAACGVGADTQLFGAYGEARSEGLKASALALGGKTGLGKSGASAYTLAYALGAQKAPGSHYTLEDLSVSGVVSTELGQGWMGHLNLGLSHSRSAKQNTTFWSAGIERLGEWIFAADLFGDDRNKPGVSTGVGWEATKGLILSATYAVLLDKPRIKQVALGAKFEF